MQLTPEVVHALVRQCLFPDGISQEAMQARAVTAEGITATYGFDPERLQKHAEAIGALLAELPDAFQERLGGGWSFLNACMDRHGRLWTGEHRTMEALLCLGISAGQARWLLPRDMWSALPGGMPYVAVGAAA